MGLFITSDTHFGHENIIRLCDRPFSSVEEMDEALIANWNAVVGPRDDVWHLGDFAFRTTNMVRYFDRLNGRKFFVAGNHDNDETAELGWLDVVEYKTLKHAKRRFVLFHYPILEWDGWYRDSIHLHGHQHNKEALQAIRRIDVGVDANLFRPWAIEELVVVADHLTAAGVTVDPSKAERRA